MQISNDDSMRLYMAATQGDKSKQIKSLDQSERKILQVAFHNIKSGDLAQVRKTSPEISKQIDSILSKLKVITPVLKETGMWEKLCKEMNNIFGDRIGITSLLQAKNGISITQHNDPKNLDKLIADKKAELRDLSRTIPENKTIAILEEFIASAKHNLNYSETTEVDNHLKDLLDLHNSGGVNIPNDLMKKLTNLERALKPNNHDINLPNRGDRELEDLSDSLKAISSSVQKQDVLKQEIRNLELSKLQNKVSDMELQLQTYSFKPPLALPTTAKPESAQPAPAQQPLAKPAIGASSPPATPVSPKTEDESPSTVQVAKNAQTPTPRNAELRTANPELNDALNTFRKKTPGDDANNYRADAKIFNNLKSVITDPKLNKAELEDAIFVLQITKRRTTELNGLIKDAMIANPNLKPNFEDIKARLLLNSGTPQAKAGTVAFNNEYGIPNPS